ncbi:MAG: TonB-dependent receptor [Bryobacteraceae bacterium]
MKHLTLLCLCLWAAFAQTDTARIAGTVADSSGAVVPGAELTIRNEKTGEERRITSNDQGNFVAPQLAPSSYTIIAKASGLGPAEYKSLNLQVGQQRSLNIVLQPASVTTEVTVSGGELATVDVSSASIGVNVSSREVAQIPLNGRNLSQLYLMAPGAVSAGSGSYDNIRFSGRANQENMVRFDGVEGTSIIDASPGNLNGEISSGFRLQSSLENVQEFRVDSSNFPAEFGTGTGGQISIITKSGGDAFHGSVFEYLRNDALDARNFFDSAQKSPLRLNQYGGSFGGPIAKDKTFFFLSYEGLRQRAGFNLFGQVPSASARARAVPAIQPLLAAYPKGTIATASPDFDVAQLVGSNALNEDSGGIRIDHRFSDKYSLYARYFRDQGDSFAPYDVTGSAFAVTAVAQNGVLNLQQLLRPNLINETKFGYNGPKTRTNGVAPVVPGLDLSATTVIIGGSNVLVGIGGQGSSTGIAIPSGLVRANSSTNGRGQPYTNYSLSYIDNLNWVKGNHNAKFGFEARMVRLYTDRLGGTTYSFSNMSDFLANRTSQVAVLGDVSAPSPFNGGVTGNRFAKAEWYIGYAQDEWKMRPNLVLSYGLRYEYYTPLREDKNRVVLFNTVTGTLDPPGSRDFFNSSPRNFGPRLALSWSPEKFNSKTVFRVGAGYYFGPGQLEDEIQPIESDRVSTTLPAGTLYPVNPLQVIRNFNVNDPNARVSVRAYAPGYTIPEKVLSYTASIQQELPGRAVLTVAYVGSQGRNLFLRSISNLIASVDTNPTTGAAILNRQFGNRFAEIDYKTSGGTDHYDSMQTQINRRFSHGFTVGGQWTWGHSIGDTGGSNEALTAASPYNFGLDRGNNAFDVRHSVNVNALYELPFLQKNRFLGGWEVGGVFNARTGLPLDIRITRPDVVYRDTRNGAIVANPVLVNGQPVTVAIINTPGGGNSRDVRRPDVVAGVDPFLHTGNSLYDLNPAAFAIPAPGTFGNLGRGALHGPGLSQLDLTLHKMFGMTERANLEFRAEAYNILNHANFANPPVRLANALGASTSQLQPGQPYSLSSSGGGFGVINSTVERTVGLGANRQIQLSLRLNF